MPELPEVETVRLQLLHHLVGVTITNLKVFNEKTVGNSRKFKQKLKGKTFSSIDRIGKLLIFSLKNEPDLFLLGHLKMTGQFFLVTKDSILGGGHTATETDFSSLPNKHTRVAIQLENGTTLFFNDLRKFGFLHLATKAEMEKARERFGVEATNPKLDVTTLHLKIKRKQTPIKATLLDQTLISGLGNIYVDEALFKAKILPTRLSSSITLPELKTIITASRTIMNKSIKVGGTTFQHFRNTEGKTGNFTKYLKVFGKKGQPCPTCTEPISKSRVAGRGTHFCVKCQK